MTVFFQKFESAGIFIAALIAYYFFGFSWVMFFILLLLPDIFMIGYAKSSKLGALIYNIGHHYIPPLIFLGMYCIYNNPNLLVISIIWTAHIAMDRILGFGLKEETGFKHTHLGKIK